MEREKPVDFRQEDADELHAVNGAIFGTWVKDGDGSSVRLPGILERLERIEKILKWGVALAAGIGGALGSVITHLLEAAFFKFH